ncbi:MAG: TonB-dependent receptor, partial [Prevotella sp.]|nr:TonB-dependent receptor [Prevotella sp.]
ASDGHEYVDKCLNEGMREGNTPLSAFSLDLSYHANGWYIDLIGNYYDRIYLYYTPVTRYESRLKYNNDGTEKDYSTLPAQAKGNGGFMLDASIGRTIRLRRAGQLSLNLMLTNILNNTNIVTGGMEQNRKDSKQYGQDDIRTYKFFYNPKKFYANGINGMFIVTYKF